MKDSKIFQKLGMTGTFGNSIQKLEGDKKRTWKNDSVAFM